MTRLTCILIAALITLPAAPLSGQAAGTRPQSWGFVSVRYDARSSSSIYTGYGWGAAFAMAGVVHNLRTGYAELTGGVGAAFTTGRAEHWLIVAAGRAPELSLAQLYWLPKLRLGPMTARATVKWEVPTTGSGSQEFGISPLTLTLPFARRLAGGVALDMAAAEGSRSTLRPGFQLRLALPGALVGADALRDVRGNSSRVRLHFASTFR
jgi:hypothetical protein